MTRDSHITLVRKLVVRREWGQLLVLLLAFIAVPTLILAALQVALCYSDHPTWALAKCLVPG